MWHHNEQVFYSPAQIRKAFPQVSLPRTLTDEVLASIGVYPLTVAAKPADTETGEYVQGPIVDGVQTWTLSALSAPEQAERLAARKATLRANLTLTRAQKMRLPITVGQLTIEPEDKDVLEAQVAKGNPQAQRKRRLKNGTRVMMTPAMIDAILLAYDEHVQACWDRDYDLDALIDAATTLAELPDITTGWPA